MRNDDFLDKTSFGLAKTYLAQARMHLLFHYVPNDRAMAEKIADYHLVEDNSIDTMAVRSDTVAYNREYIRELVPPIIEDVSKLAKAYIDLIHPDNDFGA